MGAAIHRVWSRPRSRIVGLGVVVLVVLVVLACVWVLVLRPSSADAAGPTIERTTRTAQVATATFEKSVTATGTLTPTVQDDVSFAASGTVTAVKVQAGDTVTKGQVLATVDTLRLKASLLAAKADLASAQAALASAQTADDGTDAATAQVAAKQAAVDVAQQSVTTAQAAMDGATLTSPDAGLVTAVNVAVGDAVSGSGSTGSTGSGSTGSGSTGARTSGSSTSSGAGTSSSGSSSAQFVIVGTSAWQVTVDVSENDVANVKKGEQVELTGDDLDGTVFGTVSSVGLLPSTSSGTVTYPVTVAVTGSPKGLHDGVSATAAIVYERRADVLAVPSAAVTTTGDTSTVQVVGADGKVTTTPVTVGERNGTQVEITKGLTAGQTVQYTAVSITGGGQGATQNGRTGGFGGFGGAGTGTRPGGEGGGFAGFGGGQGGGQGAGAGTAGGARFGGGRS